MNQQNINWVNRVLQIVAATGASLLVSLPVLAQFQYSASIFSPTAGPVRRSVDGTVAGELESAIKYYQQFQAFAEAMKSTGLIEELRTQDPANTEEIKFTVFAPTDEAFAALPEEIKADPAKLRQVLNYHIIQGQVSDQQIAEGQLSTVAGIPLEIQLNETGTEIILNNNSIVQSSQRAENGVIVVVDHLLVPPGLF